MVLVSHRHRFIYLKTYKTASTSVEVALEPCCREADAPATDHRSEEITPAGIIGARGASPGARWKNHMPARKILARLGPRRFAAYAKLAVVRNPYDRAVSLFYHHHRDADRLADAPFETVRQTFETWLQAADLRKNEPRLRLFGAYCLTHALYYETLEASLAEAQAKLGLPTLSPLPRYKSKPRRPEPYQAYYSEAAKARVAQANAWELNRFGYGFGTGPAPPKGKANPPP